MTILPIVFGMIGGGIVGGIIASIVSGKPDYNHLDNDDVRRIIAKALDNGSSRSFSDIENAHAWCDGRLTLKIKSDDTLSLGATAREEINLLLDHLDLEIEEGKRIVEMKKL